MTKRPEYIKCIQHTKLIEKYKKMVPKVREKTGAPFLQCLKGLYACEGDIEKSIEWVKQNPGFYV